MTLLALLVLAGGRAAAPVTISPGKIVDGVRPIALAPAPTGTKFAACLEDGSVRIIDAKTRQTVRQLTKHLQPAYAVAWSGDGAYIATGDETARIYVEDARTGKLVRQYRTHTKGIEKLSFNISRDLLLSTGKDDTIRVYDLTSSKPKEARLILGKGANFYGACFCPKLPHTFTTGILGIGGREYDTSSGHVMAFLTGHGGQGVYDVAYNSAGTREATAGRDGNAMIWDSKSHKAVGTLKGHQDWVMYTAFSPNGALLATASTDRTVKVWNTYSLQKIADLTGESGVGSPLCFTADGATLVTVNDGGNLQYNSVSPAQADSGRTKASKKPSRRHRRRRG